jgi:hypothetical protein
MADLLHGPHHWLERAQEARTVAEMALDPQSRHQLLDIALSYERFALMIEESKKISMPKHDTEVHLDPTW